MRCYPFILDDCGRALNAQEIDCNNAEEALQLGSAAVANDLVEVWCGRRRLARFEPERRQERPLSRMRARLIVVERRLREGEQHISQQEKVIAKLKREERDRAFRPRHPDRDPEGIFTGAGLYRRRSGKAIWIERLLQSQLTMDGAKCLGFLTATGSVHDPQGSADRDPLGDSAHRGCAVGDDGVPYYCSGPMSNAPRR